MTNSPAKCGSTSADITYETALYLQSTPPLAAPNLVFEFERATS